MKQYVFLAVIGLLVPLLRSEGKAEANSEVFAKNVYMYDGAFAFPPTVEIPSEQNASSKRVVITMMIVLLLTLLLSFVYRYANIPKTVENEWKRCQELLAAVQSEQQKKSPAPEQDGENVRERPRSRRLSLDEASLDGASDTKSIPEELYFIYNEVHVDRRSTKRK